MMLRKRERPFVSVVLLLALASTVIVVLNFKAKGIQMFTKPQAAQRTRHYKHQTPTAGSTAKRNVTQNFSCGSWQGNYAKFHQNALKSPKTAKFLVYTCLESCGGLGNRLYGITSLLYLAILTERVFLIHWEGASRLRDYLQPSHIRWDYPIDGLNMTNKSITKYHYWGCCRRRTMKHYTDIRADTQSAFLSWVSTANFTAKLPLKYEFIGAIRYFGDQLMNNQNFKKPAKEFGLPKRDSKFPLATMGCAYDFLFKPTNKLSSLIKKVRQRLNFGNKKENGDSKPHRKSICMHIRTNDFNLGSYNTKSIHTTRFKNFFSCAQEVEQLLRESNQFHLAPNEKIKWFLATDNQEVKRYGTTAYKGKILTVDFEPQHLEYSRKKDALGMILVDLTLLTDCDIFLASASSSFSNVVLGLKRHSLDSFTYGERCNGTRLVKNLKRFLLKRSIYKLAISNKHKNKTRIEKISFSVKKVF